VLLDNIAQSLAFLASSDHSRSRDVRAEVKRLLEGIAERLNKQMASEPEAKGATSEKSKKSRSSRKNSNRSASSASVDSSLEGALVSPREYLEQSICLSLKRLKILSYKIDVSHIMTSESEDDPIKLLRDCIVDGVSKKLEMRQVDKEFEKDDDETIKTIATIPPIWNDDEYTSTHALIAGSTCEALDFLLATTGWELARAMKTIEESGDNEADDDVSDHNVIVFRKQMERLLVLCYEQWLPELDEDSSQEYSQSQLDFSDRVQMMASRVQSDLRTLFPKDWADAESPLLRACALQDDTNLVGGFIRYFRAKEDFLRECETETDDGAKEEAMELLLPFVRNLYVNWKRCNRREAGHALMHMVGSGEEAKRILTTLAKQVKKVDPVRWLETHMACLNTAFEEYLDLEPEEISDNPTDEECAAFEEAEAAHIAKFETLESLATRLSQSLGVGKLNDKKLEKPLPGFISEGVRFAFSTNTPEGQEDFLPGARLMFLNLMAKYAVWIKNNLQFRKKLWQDIEARETQLQSDPDFDPAKDDMDALENFKKCIATKEYLGETSQHLTADPEGTESTEGEDVSDDNATPRTVKTPSSRRSTGTRGNSVGTYASNVSALSPLMEETDSSGSDASPAKRRKMSRISVDSNITMSTFGGTSRAKTQETIEEEDDSETGSFT